MSATAVGIASQAACGSEGTIAAAPRHTHASDQKVGCLDTRLRPCGPGPAASDGLKSNGQPISNDGRSAGARGS
eukprot:scaffold91735_cov60-Phaeocystis_antarctica.AAC.9